MQHFTERVRRHAEHVLNVGAHCTTEETTKQALILPLLDTLGFSPFDPTRVKAEHGADFPGAKANERVDYALFCHGVPVMFVEAKAVSDMVVSGLSAKPSAAQVEAAPVEAAEAGPRSDLIDPDNPRIVTTYTERRLLEVALDILGPGAEVVAKDNESYFALLYQGKVNRWLVRYHADGKSPRIQVCVPMTDERQKEVARAGLQFGAGDSILLPQPEHLMRIPGIVFDAYEYCRDDNNFKRGSSELK